MVASALCVYSNIIIMFVLHIHNLSNAAHNYKYICIISVEPARKTEKTEKEEMNTKIKCSTCSQSIVSMQCAEYERMYMNFGK